MSLNDTATTGYLCKKTTATSIHY